MRGRRHEDVVAIEVHLLRLRMLLELSMRVHRLQRGRHRLHRGRAIVRRHSVVRRGRVRSKGSGGRGSRVVHGLLLHLLRR